MSAAGEGGGPGSGIVEWTKNNFYAIAGIAGVAVVGYAIYFDHNRRNAPDYKQKIREKRKAKAAARGSGGAGHGMGDIDVPNPLNPSDMQAFFLQEVQIGEELMSSGNVEEGAEHIANAVLICGQSNQLLSIFQQTLPPEHFALVLEKMPTAKERLASRFEQAADVLEASGPPSPPTIVLPPSEDPDNLLDPSSFSPIPFTKSCDDLCLLNVPSGCSASNPPAHITASLSSSNLLRASASHPNLPSHAPWLGARCRTSPSTKGAVVQEMLADDDLE